MNAPSKFITATTRAARIVAGAHGQQSPEDTLAPLREAEADGHVRELVLAMALRCADLADQLYGDHAQRELDQFAFDALNYASRP